MVQKHLKLFSMETREQKMQRQYLSLVSQIEAVCFDHECYNIAIKIGLFDKENIGCFIVNTQGGHNYTCSRLTNSLWNQLESKRDSLFLEDQSIRSMLADLNRFPSPKITTNDKYN